MIPKTRMRRRRAPRRKIRGRRQYHTRITRIRGLMVPDKMLVKFPYIDYQKVNAAGGPNGNYFQKTYSLNSLFDPEPGAINSFPLGTAEYAQLYQKYRVYAASYEIALWNGSDDTSVTGSLYISNAGGTGGSNNLVTSWLTQPRARTFHIGNKSGGRSQIVLRGKVSLPGYAGLTAQQYKTTTDTEGVLQGGSPVNNVKMFINLTNTNQGVTTALVYATVKIIYHAEVYDRDTYVTTTSSAVDDPDGQEEPELMT